ncbi:MAG: hypothetical protein QM668_18280 [Agriterribacter sp.]
MEIVSNTIVVGAAGAHLVPLLVFVSWFVIWLTNNSKEEKKHYDL